MVDIEQLGVDNHNAEVAALKARISSQVRLLAILCDHCVKVVMGGEKFVLTTTSLQETALVDADDRYAKIKSELDDARSRIETVMNHDGLVHFIHDYEHDFFFFSRQFPILRHNR